MVNRSRSKGTRFEVEVRDFFKAHGFPNCERLPSEGAADRGDLSGLPVTVEIKNHRAMDLGDWCTEAQKEAVNAGTYRWCVVHKRAHKPVRDAYATVPLWVLAEFLRQIDYLEAQLEQIEDEAE